MRVKINPFLPDVGNNNNERKTERQTDRKAEGGEGGRKEETAASQDPSTWWLTLAISRGSPEWSTEWRVLFGFSAKHSPAAQARVTRAETGAHSHTMS